MGLWYPHWQAGVQQFANTTGASLASAHQQSIKRGAEAIAARDGNSAVPVFDALLAAPDLVLMPNILRRLRFLHTLAQLQKAKTYPEMAAMSEVLFASLRNVIQETTGDTATPDPELVAFATLQEGLIISAIGRDIGMSTVDGAKKIVDVEFGQPLAPGYLKEIARLVRS